MKTKNLIAKLILIVMVVLSVIAIYSNRKVEAATWTDSNDIVWYYNVISSGSSYGYGSSQRVVTDVRIIVPSSVTYIDTIEIPRTLGGYPVVHIGSWKNQENLDTAYNGDCGFVKEGQRNFVYKSSSYIYSPSNYVSSPASCTSVNAVKIKNIVIPDTVVSIGEYAFSGVYRGSYVSYNGSSYSSSERMYSYNYTFDAFGFSGLESISFPKRLQQIGAYGFQRQNQLVEINFAPKGALTNIGNYAFEGCSKLTTINIPKSVTTIGNYAFGSCSNVESLNFVDNAHITNIGSSAFYNCTKLANVNFAGRANISTIADSAFNGDTLITSFNFTKLPNLTTLGNYAFYKTNLTSVDFSNCSNLTTIGANCFDGVSTLTGTVYIGNNVTTIGNNAFNGTKINNLEIANAENSKAFTVGSYAFSGTKISSLSVDKRFTSIGNYAFSSCSNLRTVIYENDSTIKVINGGTYYNSPISTLVLPDGIIKIDNIAFQGTKLTSITLPSTIKTLGTNVFKDSTLLTTVVIEESEDTTNRINTIPEGTFYNTGLTTITMPDYISGFGNNAFRKTKLTSFEISNNITSMGTYVFAECSDLTTVTYEDTTQMTTIPNYTFYKSGLKTFVIPDGITSIGQYAFFGTNLTDLEIKANVSTIGSYAFSESTLENVIISSPINNANANTSYYIFSKCENLRRVEFTEGSNIEKIPNYMFNNSSIEEVIVPEGLIIIGDYAFAGSKLESFTLPSTVTTIGNYAFSNTTELTEFDFADNSELTYIGNYMFYNSAIIDITIPSYINRIGTQAFYNSKITSIVIPNSVTIIEQGAFQKTADLTSVEFEEECQVTSLPSYLFSESGIESIDIPESVTSIGQYCFYNSKIDRIFIPKNVATLGSYAFSSTKEAVSMEIEEGTALRNIPSACFSASGIETIKIPEGITSMEEMVFYNCRNLHGDIVIPNSVTSLRYYTFKGCTSLSGDLIIGNGVQTIPASFTDENCTKFDRVILGTGVRTVETNSKYTWADVTNPETGEVERRYGCAYNDGAFPHLTKIYVKGDKNQITFQEFWNAKQYEYGQPYTVYKYYDYVTLSVGALPGIKIVNADTEEELVTSTYSAGTVINYKVEIESGYESRYTDLKIYRSTMDGSEGDETVDLSNEIQTMTLAENGFIYVITTDSRTDMALRVFLSGVNNSSISERNPSQVYSEGNYEYLHSKKPYEVKSGDILKYTIRVYNEGTNNASIDKVHVFIPEGLKFVSDLRSNNTYGWVEKENGECSSEYLKDQIIYSNFSSDGNEKYRDIQIYVKATVDVTEENQVFNIIAEIEDQETEDYDSEPGTITGSVGADYKQEERDASTSISFIAGVQDDDDFESVVVKRKNKSEYQIKISKIDGSTKALLKGAKFNLLNEQREVVDTAYTDENGELTFTNIVTYGDQRDIYYVEEQETPEGYIIPVKSKVKIIVNKTSLNTAEGTYSVSMDYELIDYDVDTTKLKYMPITNEEQLKKIGSGEVVEVNGVNYTYAPDGYYQLLNDIELSTDSNWKPIEGFKGVLEGNNHKISNLLYQTEDDYTDVGVIGLFGSFEGMIDSVILDNVQIHVNTINTEKKTTAGHTGIGAFAGEMVKGTIQNCTVNASITASTDNIGGFVGHTVEGNITNFVGDTFNAIGTGAGIVGKNISETEEEREATEEELAEVSALEPNKTIYIVGENGLVSGTQVYTNVNYLTSTAATTYSSTASNIGGFVGCALGSINMDNCTNNAPINTPRYNGAGLVGYIDATDYTNVTNVRGSIENNVISFVLENTRTSGNYELRLGSKDAQTLGLIEGGIYQVLDKNKQPVEGYENVEIVGNSVKVADVDIYNYGVDTYYISEVEPADGYNRMTAKIKIEITKYWDHEAEKFKVKVRVLVLSNEEYEADVAKTEEGELDSYTGKTYEIDTTGEGNEEDTVLFKKKAKIENSTNNGAIKGVQNPFNVAGLVANVQCKIEVDGCVNNGDITSSSAQYVQVSGGIAELSNFRGESSIIKNTVNKGDISTEGGQSAKATGIVTHAFTNLEVDRCSNEGSITSSGTFCNVSGIIGSSNGHIKVTNTDNKGDIEAGSVGTNTVVGGILADADLYGFVDWASGDQINSKYYTMLQSNPVEASDYGYDFINCHNYASIYGSKTTGGIAGFVCGTNLTLEDCSTESLTEDKILIKNYGQMAKGGLIGNSSCAANIIKNCSLKKTNMCIDETYSGEYNVGGIIGSTGVFDSRARINSSSWDYAINSISIENCNINNCNISQYGGSTPNIAGVIGFIYDCKTPVTISGCNVKDTTLAGAYTNDGHTAGLMGEMYLSGNERQIIIQDNNVENLTIANGYRGAYYEIDAGLVGCTNSGNINLVAQYNTVKNLNVKSGNAEVGGIFGGAGYSTPKSIVFDHNTVEGLKTEMTGGSGSYKNQGGIVGSLGQYSSSSTYITLVNNKTKDLDLFVYPNYSPNVGGIAGYIAPYSATICSNTVDNIKIYQQGGSSYPAHGGIIGSIYGYSSSGNGLNTYIMDNHVTNFEDYYRGDYYASTGGIIASMYNTKYKIDNCTIEGCKIDTTSAAAGILARLSYSYSSNINEITNCKAYDIDITHTGASNYSYVFVGGAFGAVDAKTISDIDVKNVKIAATGGLPNVGGVIGWKYNSSTNSSTDNNYINNVSVKNVDIKTSSCSGYAYGLGGMIGNLYNNSVEMNNCHAEDIKVNPGSGYGSVGGLIGDPASVNLEMTDVSVKNAELYSQRNVYTNSSSYNGVGGVLGCGSLNGLKMTDVEAEDITVYNQALQAGILNASYIGNNVELHNVSVNNSKIIDETINTSRYVYSSGYCSQSVGIFGGPYVSGNFKAYDVTVKDVEIEGCAQQIGFVNYISSSNSEFYNIDFEDIKIVNHAFRGARSHSPTSCDQVTVILAQYLGNSTTTISGLKFKDIEVFSEQGHVAGIAGYMYEANLNGCEFENVKLKDTCEFNDYGNCMGLIAAAAGGNITVNGGCTKNCEIREKDGCLGNVGALIGSGYAYVVMNSHNVEDVIIENMGDEQLSGMTSNQATTGGIMGTGFQLKINDCDIHDIDISAGKHDYSTIITGGVAGELVSGGSSNDIINSNIHDINIVNNANDMAGNVFGYSYSNINIDNSEIYNIDLVETKKTFTGRAPMLGGITGFIYGRDEVSSIRNSSIHDLNTENNNADMTGGLIGGIGSGSIVLENDTINNLNVVNKGFTKANEYTGGLIGLAYTSGITISEVDIDTINVENDSSPAIGGLIGMNSGILDLKGSSIKNLDVKHTNTQSYTNPSFVGGLVGYQGGNADIKALDKEIVIQEAIPATDEDEGSEAIIEHEYVNNEIENISITNNYGGAHGGLIGFANQYVNVENANIDNITSDISVSQVYTGYNDFGGLVGSSEMYTRVVDTEINNNKTESNISSYMGGIVGFIHRQDAKPEVHDVVMNDIIVKQVVPYELMNRSPRAGGITTIINYTDDNNDETDDDTTFENIEINELAVIADVYAADGSKLCIDNQNETGGLAAITKHITATTGTSEYTGDPIIIVPAVDGILKVRNITITNTSDTFEDGTKKEIYGSGHTGGLLGYGRVEVENVTLDNVDVRGSLNVGGAVGHSDGANSIANFTIKNSNIVSTDVMDMPSYHVGGVIGFVGEDSIINNASVDNCIINNEGYGNVGGIVGTTLYDNIYEKNVTISNSEVVNCIHEDDNGVKTGITGKAHVGGFVGFGKLTTSGSSTIENCYIAGTRKADEYKYGYLNTDVGSIIGNTLGSSYINGIDVTDCVVENNKLREKRLPEEEYNYTDNNNHVGVFAGMNPANNNSNIVNCTSTNVTVTMNEL